jgi:hypothetical protein
MDRIIDTKIPKTLFLQDVNFSHQKYSAPYCSSKLFSWNRSLDNYNVTTGLVVVTDRLLNDQLFSTRSNTTKYKYIAWLIEPTAINPSAHDWICHHYEQFAQVWTNNRRLLSLLPNARFIPGGGCWLREEDIKMWPKTRLCSFISSNKNFTTGHQFRQRIRCCLPERDGIDQFGFGFKALADKIDGLSCYAYSIVVENVIEDDYFTEKIIDCFLTNTIPIYCGTRAITNYGFDADGIIFFNNLLDLHHILTQIIGVSDYESRLTARRHNLVRAKEWFLVAEDWGFRAITSMLECQAGDVKSSN